MSLYKFLDIKGQIQAAGGRKPRERRTLTRLPSHRPTGSVILVDADTPHSAPLHTGFNTIIALRAQEIAIK